MNITPDLFEAHLKCPTKCWLRAAGEPPAGNEYADWVKTQSESYRVTATERLLAQTPPAETALSLPAENLKTAKWRLAMRLVARASTLPRSSRREEAQTEVRSEQSEVRPDQSVFTSAATSLESCLHAVGRIPSEGRGKAAQFIPIRFISRNKLTKDDRLLLAFDALVLSEAFGRNDPLGKIIHGDDHATLKVKTSALAGEVRKRLDKIAALLANPAPPDLVLNRHCAECEFREARMVARANVRPTRASRNMGTQGHRVAGE